MERPRQLLIKYQTKVFRVDVRIEIGILLKKI